MTIMSNLFTYLFTYLLVFALLGREWTHDGRTGLVGVPTDHPYSGR